MLIRCTRSSWAQLIAPYDLVRSPLPTLKTDAFTMSCLRGVLREGWPFEDIALLTDDAVLERLGQLLAIGEVTVEVIAEPQREVAAATPPPAEPAPPPPVARTSPPPAEEPEPETFSPGHDPVTQAAVLTAAASSGTPFCEACARQKAAAAGGNR